MRRKLLVVGFTLVLAGSLFGQRRGPGGMQGNQSAGGGAQSMGTRGSDQQMQIRDQQRLRLHTTDQQMQQSRT